jgi:hypothetical protein
MKPQKQKTPDFAAIAARFGEAAAEMIGHPQCPPLVADHLCNLFSEIETENHEGWVFEYRTNFARLCVRAAERIKLRSRK